jgi:predicted permease
MPSIREWLSRLRGVVFSPRRDTDLDEELRSHLQMATDDLVRSGMPRDEARRRAIASLGGVTETAERCRELQGSPLVEGTMQDLRYAIRLLKKSPGFALVAIGILAVTIGANAAVYTLVDRLIVRPLPYPQADRLGTVIRYFERTGGTGDHTNGFAWLAMRDGVPGLDFALSGGDIGGVNLTTPAQTAYVRQQRVSSGFFRVLGVAPALGREFTAEEDRPGGPAVVVLSHRVWTQDLDADPTIIGKTITLRGEPFVIVGVMPASFRSHLPADVWTPLRPSTAGEGSGGNYSLIARLQPGVRWADVAQQVDVVGRDLIRDRFRLPPNVAMSFRLVPWQDAVTRDIRRPLLVLWSSVLVVLLIGCVNIAGLLLARGAARAPEIATRLAIGGSRNAIARQLFVESLVLAAAGAAAGVGLGYVLSNAMSTKLADTIALPTAPDLRVLDIASSTALGTSLLFGLFPALHTSRLDVRSMLGEGVGAIAGRSRRWPTRLLVVSQVALGIVLVVAAGLLLRSFNNLMRLHSGVSATNVVAGTMSLQDARYATDERVNSLFTQSLERIAHLPGVELAAVALSLPYERTLNSGWRFDGEPQRPTCVATTYVTPGYFRTLRIPVLRGRVFDDHDSSSAPLVAVVNDAFVRQHGGGRDVLGRRLNLGGPKPLEIVGVVGSVQQIVSCGGGAGPVDAVSAAYVPASQVSGFTLAHTWFQPSWIVRTVGPVDVAPAMQRAIHDIDPQLTFRRFRTIEDVQSETMATTRIQAVLLGALAAIALGLCVAGVYGLVANSVVERRRELGVRIALGSSPLQTLKTAAAGGVGLAACGTAVGLVLSVFVTRVMRQMVFEIPVNDPLTLAAAAACVIVTASAAAVVPALRTLRLNVSRILNAR